MGETSYINYRNTLKLGTFCVFTLYPNHLKDNSNTLTNVGLILSFLNTTWVYMMREIIIFINIFNPCYKCCGLGMN